MFYGEDFIEQSIKSIIDNVDKVFVLYTDKPWGEFEYVMFKGEKIYLPCPIDKGVDKVKSLEKEYPGKIHSHYFHSKYPDNQFTEMYDYIKLRYDLSSVDTVIIMEPDMIWPVKNKLEKIISYVNKVRWDSLCTFQVEFWKTGEYMIPIRQRPGAILYNISLQQGLPTTGKNGACGYTKFINHHIYNYGFCMSPYNMYIKHLVGLGISHFINDSVPYEEWYEDKWKNWDFTSNNYFLEPSRNYKSNIPYAIKFDIDNIVYPEPYMRIIL